MLYNISRKPLYTSRCLYTPTINTTWLHEALFNISGKQPFLTLPVTIEIVRKLNRFTCTKESFLNIIYKCEWCFLTALEWKVIRELLVLTLFSKQYIIRLIRPSRLIEELIVIWLLRHILLVSLPLFMLTLTTYILHPYEVRTLKENTIHTLGKIWDQLLHKQHNLFIWG